MRALLLAAGYGTRLKPITDNIPKCLVPINGKPLLDFWLEELYKADIGPILINTHYLSNQVEKYVNDCQYFGGLKLVYEPILLGTAGTIIKNIDFFNNEDCMVIHADNYSLANILRFKEEHIRRPNQCLMSMLTFRTENPTNCGIVEVDENNIVINFHEKIKNPPGNLANGAVYIISKELLNIISKDYKMCTDFSTDVISKLLGKIYSHEISQVFIDIGTPENYKKANELNNYKLN